MDDEQQLEDDLIYQAEALDVHATRWQDSRMLKEMHIEEDFAFFLEHTRLDGFASRPYKTYAEITRELLASFRFAHTEERVGKRCKIIPAKFDVKFVMKQRRFVMSIDDFCKAINVPNVGSWEEIPSDSDEQLRIFWRSISLDVPNERYFSLFLVRGFLARKNTTASGENWKYVVFIYCLLLLL
jgi:hypothetical protein